MSRRSTPTTTTCYLSILARLCRAVLALSDRGHDDAGRDRLFHGVLGNSSYRFACSSFHSGLTEDIDGLLLDKGAVRDQPCFRR